MVVGKGSIEEDKEEAAIKDVRRLDGSTPAVGAGGSRRLELTQGSNASRHVVSCGADAEVGLVLGQLGFGAAEVHLELAELVLEQRDDADAAVDGVAEPHVRLVSQRVHGVLALVRLQLVQQLRHVARAEHLVHARELLRLIRREIRREHALRLALPPQKLASRARRKERAEGMMRRNRPTPEAKAKGEIKPRNRSPI
nr:serine, glycine, tyrosine and glutamine-rich protein-like [Ipomoea batatas]